MMTRLVLHCREVSKSQPGPEAISPGFLLTIPPSIQGLDIYLLASHHLKLDRIPLQSYTYYGKDIPYLADNRS
jgi:hypothetical protein